MNARASILSVLVGLVLLAACGRAHADNALVVGVDKYKNIPDATLTGCASDARSVADMLQKRGFKVVLITDGQATRDGILGALKQMRSLNKPNERFVFYFAGHGSGPTPGVILNNSSLASSNDNDIKAEELNAEIKAIPASSRTVLLDSCFSGSMIRAFKFGRKNRYYTRSIGPAGSKDLVLKANNQDSNHELSGTTTSVSSPTGSSGVCYFTAARQNEVAQEDEFNGIHHGVFTYFLLKDSSASPSTWGELQTHVSSEVVEHLQDQQHPTLSPNFVSAPFLGGSASAPPPAPPKPPNTVLTLINTDKVDKSKISITMDPDKAILKVNEQVSFRITVGAPGYLVLIEHGTSGRVNLLFPENGSVSSMQVSSGQVITIPSDPSMRYTPDATGVERLRAILFSNQAEAQAVVDGLKASGAGTSGQAGAEFPELIRKLKGRDLVMQRASSFYTSDITFEVK